MLKQTEGVGDSFSKITTKTKEENSLALVRELYQPSICRLSANLVPTFADGGSIELKTFKLQLLIILLMLVLENSCDWYLDWYTFRFQGLVNERLFNFRLFISLTYYICTLNLVDRSMGRCRLSRLWSSGTVT
jgi:hypothetical protein